MYSHFSSDQGVIILITDLDYSIENVKGRESFLVFVMALVEDHEEAVKIKKEKPSSSYGSGAKGWGNSTIEHYLESAAAWKGREEELPENPSWKSLPGFIRREIL